MTMKSMNSSPPEYMRASSSSDSSVDALINKAINGHIDGPPFICPICSYSFEIRHRLVRHVVLHSDVKPYKCNYCEKSFKRKDYVKYHMQEYHKEEFEAQEENKASSSVNQQQQQRTTVSSSEQQNNSRSTQQQQKTNASDKNSSSGSTNHQHLQTNKIYKCRFCDGILDTRYQLRHHENEHMGLNTESPSIESTSKHPTVKTETTSSAEQAPLPPKNKRYYCNSCPVSYSRKCDLQKHIQKKHTNETTESPAQDGNNTTVCTATGKEERSCKIETGTTSEGESSSQQLTANCDDTCNYLYSNGFYQCQTCNKVFETEESKKLHETIHLNQQRFQCSRCTKTYSRRDSLRKHIRNKHNGQGKVIVMDSLSSSQENFDIKKIVFDSNFENFSVTFDFNTGRISHVSPLNGSFDLSKLKSAFNAYNGAQSEQPPEFKEDSLRQAPTDNSDIWSRLADNFTIQPDDASLTGETKDDSNSAGFSSDVTMCCTNATAAEKTTYSNDYPAKKIKLDECGSADSEMLRCYESSETVMDCDDLPTDLSIRSNKTSSTTVEGAHSCIIEQNSASDPNSVKVVLSIFDKLDHLNNVRQGSHEAKLTQDGSSKQDKKSSATESAKAVPQSAAAVNVSSNENDEAVFSAGDDTSCKNTTSSPLQQQQQIFGCMVPTIFEKLDSFNSKSTTTEKDVSYCTEA